MAHNKDTARTPQQIAAHRAVIADRYIRGDTQALIAAGLGVSIATVSRDLKILHAEWQARHAALMDQGKAETLAKLDTLEREYWAAWERSQQTRTITSTESVQGSGAADTESKAGKKRAAIRKEDQCGNPAYLAGVQWVLSERCKILGVYAPIKEERREDGSILIQIEYVNDPVGLALPPPRPAGD